MHSAATAQVIIALLFGDKLNTGKTDFGIVVSPALTNISHLDSKSKSGLNLSLFLDFRPDRPFYLHIEGIAKGSFGAKDIRPYSTENDSLDHLFANGSVERKIKTFGLPVLVRYKISSLFSAEAGIQANMRLKAQDIFKTEVQGNDLEYTVTVTKELTWLDFGVAGGLYYKFSKKKSSMGVGVRYFQGLTDTYKTMTGNQVNTAWQLNITIPIGAGKNANANQAKGSNTENSKK
ncbi:hypothetical protein SY85_00645 [Flavisolibacter tropicus]|uniref:Outer membrane protein beta-barrel domain-containing protein n=1 Tax=Flavisolibacter tropicus TaxID=1492898 RepID=A0A172TQ90_9BACT|nr:hypothetical protein SY85_00645 [Flavisolibacter tropicus]